MLLSLRKARSQFPQSPASQPKRPNVNFQARNEKDSFVWYSHTSCQVHVIGLLLVSVIISPICEDDTKLIGKKKETS